MPINITPDEIQVLGKYIFNLTGITIGQDKGYLLETRLHHLLAEYNCANYSELYYKANSSSSRDLPEKIIDAISTNETYFFRDNTPFDLLRNKIIPDLIDYRRRTSPNLSPLPIRIWSAACSSGQEVYSIGITLLEMGLGGKEYDISILGTDISNNIIAQASYGKYNKFEVERGLAPQLRTKYFTQAADGWRIKDQVRVLAKFSHLNLQKQFPASVNKFDIIFCRNVAIYFNMQDKIRLFRKISRVLEPHGSLIIGGSETLTDKSSGLAPQYYLRGIFYQHNEHAKAAGDATTTVATQRPQPVGRPTADRQTTHRPQPKQAAIDTRLTKTTASAPSPPPLPKPEVIVRPESKKELSPQALTTKPTVAAEPAPPSPRAKPTPTPIPDKAAPTAAKPGAQERPPAINKKSLISSVQKQKRAAAPAPPGNSAKEPQKRSSLLAAIATRQRKKDQGKG